MIHQLNLKSERTYVTKERALKAINSMFSDSNFRYLIVRNDEGRFYPICIGHEAVQAGTHFHFVTVA